MEPFCFVAEKDGRCLGVCAAGDDLLKKFYSDFVGFEIKSLSTREDWISYMDAVPFGPEREIEAPHV